MTVRPIGGEMQVWSDLDGRHGPGPVRGEVLAPLLATVTGRTLVVGPLDPALLDAVPADDLTVLVRGVPDAEALATHLADRPGATVLCGSPEKLATEPPYDSVVALDGTERLGSTEGADLTWAETVALLVAVLRPGGRLLLAAENHLGVHRLVALPPEVTDSDWAGAGEYDPDRPAGLDRLRAGLAGAGLSVTRTYAAWPAPIAPAALVAPELLADQDAAAFLRATLGRACAPRETVLTDPERLVATALRHGAAATLAPAWILQAERIAPDPGPSGPVGGRPAAWATGAAAGGVPSPALPEALVMIDGERVEVVHRPGGGLLLRRPDGATGALPKGSGLEQSLIVASVRRDLPAVRELLRPWQAGPYAGVPADQIVVTPGRDLVPLAPAGLPADAVRRLAVRLLDAGLAHLWPSPADPAELALTLVALAGQAPVPAAPAGGEPDRPTVPGVRELVADRDRLARELAEAREREAWYERTLVERETELRRARSLLAVLSGTPSARAGKLVLAGARRARRTAGAVVRRVLPHD
ncbi:hypothetical protein [Micromonospora costi]|uniref:Class I SAM-dependent methyltransferase n=1 Tax=Micromonospora costi TaxID=1530042 RepID=A0A3A9ZUP4_9ACTN|nr:hypothetical protein [Micromonospora costi]RKN52032.1 hypothetical protein D7193_26000 [Micromonospora costi]